jgi:hypothetical protein
MLFVNKTAFRNVVLYFNDLMDVFILTPFLYVKINCTQQEKIELEELQLTDLFLRRNTYLFASSL